MRGGVYVIPSASLRPRRRLKFTLSPQWQTNYAKGKNKIRRGFNPHQTTQPVDIRNVKLLDATDSYIAITETDECINTIFEEATQNALSIEGFTPILSPEKRAKLILVFKRLEREILEQPEDAIKRAVEERAPFATVDNIC